MPISPPIPPQSIWTVADLEQLPADGNRYEILFGELLVTPMPVLWHQRVAARLTAMIGRWCEANPGWEFFAPGGVFISETSWLEPDVAVYSVPGGKQASHWRELHAPALVIEILSPSTRNTDRHRKRPAYIAHGVAQVWLVDIDAKSLERWTRNQSFRSCTTQALHGRQVTRHHSSRSTLPRCSTECCRARATSPSLTGDLR